MIARRRLTIGLVCSAVLFALIGGLVWFVGVPNWRPPLHVGEAYGIDVASHQGEINWPAVARDNISFAYIKATEGGDFADRYFTTNWREAEAAAWTGRPTTSSPSAGPAISKQSIPSSSPSRTRGPRPGGRP